MHPISSKLGMNVQECGLNGYTVKFRLLGAMDQYVHETVRIMKLSYCEKEFCIRCRIRANYPITVKFVVQI